MKKALYFIFLAVELLVGVYILALSSSWIGWAFFAVVTAVWVALMVWQIVKLKKAKEDKDKRKRKIFMALIMLLPTVASVGGILWIRYMYF